MVNIFVSSAMIRGEHYWLEFSTKMVTKCHKVPTTIFTVCCNCAAVYVVVVVPTAASASAGSFYRAGVVAGGGQNK